MTARLLASTRLSGLAYPLRAATLAAGILVFGRGTAGAQVASTDLVARGQYLTAAGDCVACHTAPGGQPFAGGLYMNTPFGAIVSPNITPDPETGIGKWSDEDLYKALHNGVRRDGQFIYPAMPYPWLTKVTREDVAAIKAYLFSLAPIHAPKPPNTAVFSVDVRAGMLAWNTLYFRAGEFKPDPAKSEQVNRGAYLVEGLGHCAACHTPKNVAMASIDSRAYAGARLDGWYAPNISSDEKDGIGGWTEDELATYLKTGQAHGKGVVFGPMAQTVSESLSRMTDTDLHAIAAYLKQTAPQSAPEGGTTVAASDTAAGSIVYQNYCASCHLGGGQGVDGRVPPLAGNGAVTAQGPDNVIRVVAGGLPANGSYAPMPGFAAVLSDQQIADVANFVRRSWGNGAPANATPDMVAKLAGQTRSMLSGTQACTKLGDSEVDRLVTDPAGGIPALLQSTDSVNMLNQVDALVPKLQAAAAAKADVVNSLTAAYCAVVAKDDSLNAVQRYQNVTRFSALAWTQLTDHGQK